MPSWPKGVKFTHLKPALKMESGTAASGMCFHRAAAMVLDLPGAEVCFGIFNGGTPEQCAADPRISSVPFIHAWVEWRGNAFAPTLFEQMKGLVWMVPESYYAVNGARNIKRLPRPELLRIARETGLSAHLRRNADLKGSFIEGMLDAVGFAFTVHPDGGILPAEENTMAERKRMGRPPLNRTADEAIAARKAARAKSKAKSKNVTIDADILPLLYTAQKKLAKELGFEPTISQTLRALIKRAV